MTNIQSQQILLPKKVYIGDTAELRVTFSCPAQFTSNTPGAFASALNQKEYVIQNINLLQAGVNYYQISINFTPWKTGTIKIPPYILTTSEGEEYCIVFEPVTIVSVLDQKDSGFNTTVLQSQNAPFLMPGTAYKLWIGLIIFVLLLILIIRIIIKRKELLFFIKNKKLIRKYKKNKRQTIKKLKQIINPKAPEKTDKEKAEQLQKLMRNYLEVRFEYPFTKTVTSQIMNGFNEATGGIAEESKINAAGEIAGMFVRTDYVRYAKNAVFLNDEVREIIKQLITNIEALEAQNV